MNKRLLASLLVLATATALRFHDLPARPFHHDEGVNGFFLQRLHEFGEYKYDPANYHGPTLYFLTLPLTKALGLRDEALRGLTALAGLGAVLIALSMRGVLGRTGALSAAALLAVSNSAVYYSRYYIHESLVVLFGLGAAAAALRYLRTGRLLFLYLGGASLGLLLATKETTVVHIAVALIAAVLAMLTRPGRALPRPSPAQLGTALGVLLGVAAVFYSSFGRDPSGLEGALKTLAIWAKTGREAHVNPWYQHALWLWEGDPALLVAGAIGLLLVLVPTVIGLPARWRELRGGGPEIVGRPGRTDVALAAGTIGILCAYSLVAYKTPWLALNVSVPLALLGGLAVERVAGRSRPVAALLLVAALAVSARTTMVQCFERPADETLPWAYAHTDPRYPELVRAIQSFAERSGAGTSQAVTVTSPDYWPLPWTLHGYPAIGYWGKVPETIPKGLILATAVQLEDIGRVAAAAPREIGRFPLRPGVELVLLEKP